MKNLPRLFLFSVFCCVALLVSCASSGKEGKSEAKPLTEYVVAFDESKEAPPESVAVQAPSEVTPEVKSEAVAEVKPEEIPEVIPEALAEIAAEEKSEVQPESAPDTQTENSEIGHLEQKPVVDTIEQLDAPPVKTAVLDQAEFILDFSEPIKENSSKVLLAEVPIKLFPEVSVFENTMDSPVFVEPAQTTPMSTPKTVPADLKTPLPVNLPLTAESVLIMGTGLFSAQQLFDFFKNKNPKGDLPRAERLAALYVEECRLEGVNSDLAFVQMCHETGFLQFGSLVTADMNNFCGLGAIDARQRGERFDTEQLGVRAHVQHLKAYGSTEALTQPLVDPRYRYVNPKGKAPSVTGLTGTWASDPKYHIKLLNIMDSLYSFQEAQ